jgi:penicillin-binding protein 2
MLTPGALEDRRSSQGRLQFLRVGAMVCFAALAVSFWVLQIIRNAKYNEAAKTNHLRTVPLRAPRGVFFDRHGKVLVENRYAYAIAIVRENRNRAALNEPIRRLAEIAGVEEARIRERVQAHWSGPLFQPIVVIDHATDAQVAAVMARRRELKDVVVQEAPVRAYPTGGMAAHMVGYVNEISPAQIKAGGEFAGYQAGAMVGQAGLERVYNSRLMGKDGKKDVFVDSRNREVSEPMNLEEPKDGQRLQLTIDFDMQRALEDAYKANGLAGAAIFLDPQTGEVLAMTSQPEYDPNAFAEGLDAATWARLRSDPLNPLTNRLIRDRYAPGSTFKVLTATAALSEGVITPLTTYYCNGGATFFGRRYECDKKEGHGWIDLAHAIEKSCNVYFYNVGNILGVDKIHEYAVRLGLAGRTGIDLPDEIESIIPSSDWKLKTTGEKWYQGETISVAIGQGQVTVTPIALATMMATVANGGTVVTPHLVKAVDEGQGWRPLASPAPRSVLPIKPAALDQVVRGLWLVVNGQGTAARAAIAGHDVVGKTGTAQVISKEGRLAAEGKTDQNLNDHSWFVFFAPRSSPRVAGVVFVEHGGHGGVSSAPIARHVLDTYFAKQEGRPLPALPIAKVTVPSTLPAAPAGGPPRR